MWVSLKLTTAFLSFEIPAPKSRITNVQATVVQKLNQGTIPKSGCNRLWGPFFGYFFGQVVHPEIASGQKVTTKKPLKKQCFKL